MPIPDPLGPQSAGPATDPAGLKHRALSSVAWAAATRMVGQVLNWAMTLVVIRFLAPADYGLMALVMSVTGLLQALTATGIADALVQARTVDERLWRRCFGLILAVAVVLAALLALLAYPLAAMYREPRLVALLQVSGLSLLLLAPSAISRARLDRELAFRRTARVDMLANLVGGALVLVLAWQGAGVWALLAGMLTSTALTSVALWRMAPFRRLPSFRLGGLGAILQFGGVRTAEHVLWYVSTQVDVFVVGKLLGGATLGHYAVARNLAALPVNKFGSIVKPIGAAAFARLQDDRARALGYLLTSLRLLTLLSSPVFFGMAAVAPEVTDVVLGPRWAAVATPLAVLAAGMALRVPGLMLAPFLIALGEVRASFVNTLGALLLFTLAYGVGAHWGLLGVCVAGALAYPVQFVLLMLRIGRITGAPAGRLLASLLPPLLCAGLMFAAVAAARLALAAAVGVPDGVSDGAPGGAAARLALLIGVGALSFGIAARLLCPAALAETLAMLPSRLGAGWLGRAILPARGR